MREVLGGTQRGMQGTHSEAARNAVSPREREGEGSMSSPADLKDTQQLILVRGAGEERPARGHLAEDAPDAPDVHGRRVLA